MVFGIGKKKSKSLKGDAESYHQGPSNSQPPPLPNQRGSSRPVLEQDPAAPSTPNRSAFKYGASISKTIVDLAGLPCNVFGLNELTPVPARSSAPPPPDICVVIHLHGRTGSADKEEHIARQMYDRIARDKETFRTQQGQAGSELQRDHLIVTFDARNHGHRITNKAGQDAWKQGNKNHAMDLYGMIVGGARDASFVVDFLPSYLFQHDERTVSEWVITGKSLGGHSTWHVLADEPRIRIGVPFIGTPDFSRLLNSRTQTSFVTNGPPYVPTALKKLVETIDPARKPYDSWDSKLNPFWGKKICVLSGANDKLVLWDWNEDFLKGLVVGEPDGAKGEMTGLKIHRRKGVGHDVTEEMVEEAGEWIWRWGIVAGRT